MAISTVDGIVLGMRPPQDFVKVGTTMQAAGVMHSLFYSSGVPGNASAPTPGIGGAALTSYGGQIPFVNPSSGNSYLARFEASSTVSGTLLLVDRLWHNSAVVATTTTAQTVTSAAWAARDRDGSTNGENVLVGIEVYAATTNGSPITNTTLAYTNSSGSAGKTATMTSFPANAVAGTFVPFELAAGDTGIQSIDSVTLGTSYGLGTLKMVAYRILARISVGSANVGNYQDFAGCGLPRLYNYTVPYLIWLPTSTTAVTVSGQMTVTQG